MQKQKTHGTSFYHPYAPAFNGRRLQPLAPTDHRSDKSFTSAPSIRSQHPNAPRYFPRFPVPQGFPHPLDRYGYVQSAPQPVHSTLPVPPLAIPFSNPERLQRDSDPSYFDSKKHFKESSDFAFLSLSPAPNGPFSGSYPSSECPDLESGSDTESSSGRSASPSLSHTYEDANTLTPFMEEDGMHFTTPSSVLQEEEYSGEGLFGMQIPVIVEDCTSSQADRIRKESTSSTASAFDLLSLEQTSSIEDPAFTRSDGGMRKRSLHEYLLENDPSLVLPTPPESITDDYAFPITPTSPISPNLASYSRLGNKRHSTGKPGIATPPSSPLRHETSWQADNGLGIFTPDNAPRSSSIVSSPAADDNTTEVDPEVLAVSSELEFSDSDSSESEAEDDITQITASRESSAEAETQATESSEQKVDIVLPSAPPRPTSHPTLYQQLTEDSIDWCRYCGTTESSNWRPGPWGKRTLCNKHGCDYKGYGFVCKLPRLDLTAFVGEKVSERERPVLQLFCHGCGGRTGYEGNVMVRCEGCPRAWHQCCFNAGSGDSDKEDHDQDYKGIPDEVVQSSEQWFCGDGCRDNLRRRKVVVELERRTLPLMSTPKSQGSSDKDSNSGLARRSSGRK
ncbi:hypothetical protein BZG36_05691 [Bifiguratus adelaidae]|uniref:Zinc finger PHD-type domain-containing protein n=1 Tax=Bifiguratus adelaidae TaxID=1938954 RepID=A0A261XT77_9FUNG|nr:hypothetical protein BZG36_05691 [Bifiguratus adelaidae]